MVDINIKEISDRRVCILGLGYVGLTLAVTMADVGFKVLGVEINDSVLDKLAGGKAHFHEPGLDKKLQQVTRSGNLIVANHIPDYWVGDVYIITVGTPLDAEGHTRLNMIENVSRQVGQHMQDRSIVIMRSTVKLGTTRKVVFPILNSSGRNFELAFCPERTLEGKALIELRSLPQIVGGLTYGAGVRAMRIFEFITPTVIRVSDIETAEMIKLIDNTQRDVSFAFANEVARACDASAVSAVEVIRAGKLGYPRTNLPLPGPVGGPCLEKDPYILAESLREQGVELEITLAARRTNERQPAEIVEYLKKVTSNLPGFKPNPIITLMGLAFKGDPATDDLRGTMARPVLMRLRQAFPGASFRGYDAVVNDSEILDFGLEPVSSLEEAYVGSNLNFILNNHQVFASMPINLLATKMVGPALIYDFWNFFNTNDLHMPPNVFYMSLGSHYLTKFPDSMTGTKSLQNKVQT